ncbi:MAG: 2-oxo-4-hydroxy-4-carboxy-5-ureidoimidazoline decarboxylase [Anaerolineae bacterium]|nr:2-oxo-4-hydroxy-4-carboxy-5-ureidoimidazoline decarboxylase [Anaerolineae bacterium]
MNFATLNQLPKPAFIQTLGSIFEHSPWVAEGAYAAAPFATVEALHAAMVRVVDRAGLDRQLALIRAHPDLAGKAALAGELTAESTSEQKGAGLDRLSPEEYAEFHRLNDAYKAKFGFPFIIAVRGHDRHSILAAFETRLLNDAESERAEALAQIARIAGFRLAGLLKD